MAVKHKGTRSAGTPRGHTALILALLVYNLLAITYGVLAYMAVAGRGDSPVERAWGDAPVGEILVGSFVAGNALLLWWRFAARRDRSARGRAATGIATLVLATISFVLLSFVLRRQGGPQYLASASGEPGFGTWTLYTFNHLLRASDLLDVLEAYGLRFAQLQPANHAARVLVASFYVVVSLVITGAILRRQRRARAGGRRRRRRALSALAALLIPAGVALYVVLGMTRGWSGQVWALWPVEQVLRTVDIPDVMTLYDLRLVPRDVSILGGTAALCFRLGVAVLIIRLIVRAMGLPIGDDEDGDGSGAPSTPRRRR
jgi:hypothetical protein